MLNFQGVCAVVGVDLDQLSHYDSVYTLSPTQTAKAPENGWLEYDPYLLGMGLFSGANC